MSLMWSPMYTPHQEDTMYPTKGMKVSWRDHLTYARIGDLQRIWLVVLGLLGTLNRSTTWFYATPIDLCR